MTTYLDYKVIPEENNAAPPVGAPENMPTSMVNNVLREVMSVIRQLGDTMQTDFNALGTMSLQDADAVLITGGEITATLNGPGAGITNLKAQNLIEGPIPKTVFPADATPLDVKVARAAVADALGSTLSILPIGTILMWYSGNPIPAGWALCDGTLGTPNLVGRFPLGAGTGVALGQMGGGWTGTAATDAQGGHSHGGAVAGHAITEAQMPSHIHGLMSGYISGTPQAGAGRIWNGLENFLAGVPWAYAQPTGGNQAHVHGIGVDGNHAHNVTVPVVPIYTAIYFIMRIS